MVLNSLACNYLTELFLSGLSQWHHTLSTTYYVWKVDYDNWPFMIGSQAIMILYFAVLIILTGEVFRDLWVSGSMHKKSWSICYVPFCERTSSSLCIFHPFIWVSKVVSESVRSLQDQYNLVMLLQCHWNSVVLIKLFDLADYKI